MTSPINYINSSQSTIAGTATDSPAGIALIEIAISSSASGNNGTWYNGTGFTANFNDAGTFRSTTSFTLNGAGAGIHTWSFNRPALEYSKTYLVRLRTTDNAGNVKTQSVAEGVTFVYDDTNPLATIADPNQAYEKSLSIISGGSSDGATSITTVEVAISTGASAPFTDYFWNGSGWQSGPTPYWFTTSAVDGAFNSGNEDWTFTGSTPTWLNNRIYRVQVRSQDSAQNFSSVVASTFTFDNTPAGAGVVVPSAGSSAYRALTLITGTMSDSPNPSPLIVQVALRHPSNTFWDGVGFNAYDSNNSWLNASAVYSTSWTFTNLPASWNDRTLYKIFVRAIDRAGNPVSDPDFVNTGQAFRIDFSSPISMVSSLSTVVTTYVATPLTSVTGTANDLAGGSGVSSVNIRVRRTDGLYLNASENGFDSAAGSIDFPLSTTGGSSWSYTFGDPVNTFQDGYGYTVESRAKDSSNPQNVEQTYTSARLLVDKSTPTAALVSAVNGYFNASLTTLSGTLTDVLVPPGNTPSGVQYVNLQIFDGSEAINPWWNGVGWGAIQTSTSAVVYSSSWTLSAIPTDWTHGTGNDGRWYRFYVQAVDYAGNTQNYTVITATYDVQPGTATILMPNSAVMSSLPAVSGTATDTTYGPQGLSNVQISVQRHSDSNWYDFSIDNWSPSGSNIWNSVDSYNPATGAWSIDTTPVNLWEDLITYDVYVRAIDKAGNYQTSQLYPSTFSFVFQPPASVIALTKPINSTFYRENLTSIIGTANAATNRVDVQIQRSSDNQFWSAANSAWIVSSTYNVANALAVPNWSWNTGIPNSGQWFVNGSSYTIRARGVNTANITGTQVSLSLAYDTQLPTSVLTQPLTAFTSNFAQVAGTASDQAGLAGINNVKVDIQRINKDDTTAADGFYWSGSTWVAVRPNLTTSIALVSPNLWSWNYNIAYSTWFNDGYKYKLYFFAEDNSYVDLNTFNGNKEAEHTSNVVYDITMPTATITSVATGQLRSSVLIASGAVTDLLGASQDNTLPGFNQVNQVQVALRRNSNGSYWNGAAWQAGPIPFFSTATLNISSWTYTTMPDFTLAIYNKENFTLQVNALDNAGNQNALYMGGISSVTFIVDNQPPVATLTLPTTNAKRQQLLAISGSVDDNTASDYPNNAGVSGVGNIDVLAYYVQAGTTYYWTGSVFSSNTIESGAWQTVDGYVSQGTSSATWTYNALDNLKMNPPVVENGWISDRAYVVKTRARDNAFPTPNLGSENFALNVIIDTTTPTSGITYPNTTPIRALTTISGTANADLAGFGDIKFSIKNQAGNYFTGSSFSSAAEI